MLACLDIRDESFPTDISANAVTRLWSSTRFSTYNLKPRHGITISSGDRLLMSAGKLVLGYYPEDARDERRPAVVDYLLYSPRAKANQIVQSGPAGNTSFIGFFYTSFLFGALAGDRQPG